MHSVLVYSASQYRQRTRLESSLVPIFSESMFVSPRPHLHRDSAPQITLACAAPTCLGARPCTQSACSATHTRRRCTAPTHGTVQMW
jgi:hypothetical protein